MALHCNGNLEEAAGVLAAAGPLDAAGRERWRQAQGRLNAPKPFDPQAGAAELEQLLAGISHEAVA